MNSISLIVILIILGLAFGSFINAATWRLHKQSSIKKKDKRYSITRGRSICPKCEHQLKPFDLIPIISWLLLRGKCRYCHKPVSIMYPTVEALTTVLFVLSYIYWPLSYNARGVSYFVIWLILLVNLLVLAIYDLKWLILPTKIIYPLFGLVILQMILSLVFFNKGTSYLTDSLIGFVIGGGIFYILFQLSKGKWIGGGDVRLGALLGLYLGSPMNAILLIFLASVLGSLASVPLLVSGKVNGKTTIPYGPFLILATIILRLLGGSINSWLKTIGLSV